MQKQHAQPRENHATLAQNNPVRSKEQFSFFTFSTRKKVQSPAKQFKELLPDELELSFARYTGEVLLLRLNVTCTVQLIVKDLIRVCTCELIICGIAALEALEAERAPLVWCSISF